MDAINRLFDQGNDKESVANSDAPAAVLFNPETSDYIAIYASGRVDTNGVKVVELGLTCILNRIPLIQGG